MCSSDGRQKMVWRSADGLEGGEGVLGGRTGRRYVANAERAPWMLCRRARQAGADYIQRSRVVGCHVWRCVERAMLK